MNREAFTIGTMQYGGLGLLIVAGLFFAALDLARAVLAPAANRSRGADRRRLPQKSPLSSNGHHEPTKSFSKSQ